MSHTLFTEVDYSLHEALADRLAHADIKAQVLSVESSEDEHRAFAFIQIAAIDDWTVREAVQREALGFGEQNGLLLSCYFRTPE